MADDASHELLNDHEGRGILTLGNGVMVPVAFRFAPGPESDNRIHLNVRDDPAAIRSIGLEGQRDPLRPGRFAGTTQHNAEITCERVFVSKWTIRGPSVSCDAELMPSADVVVSDPTNSGENSATEYVFLLCNLLFRGDEMVTRKDFMDPGATTVSIAGSEIQVRMLREHDQTRSELGRHPKGLVTAEARLVSERPIADVHADTILPLCVLASLAEHCFVVPVCAATRDSLGWRVVRYQPVKTYPFARIDPAIDIARGNRRAFKQYVEACYEYYMRWRSALKLDVLIEYAVNGSLGQTGETQYLMYCIGFECLADTGERVVREVGIELPLPNYDDNMRLLSKFVRKHKMEIEQRTIEKLARSVSYNRPGMKAKLEALFTHFGVSYTQNDLRFIDVRNTLVHTGLFPADYDATSAVHELEDFYDKVVLTILQYPGRDRRVRAKGFRTEGL